MGNGIAHVFSQHGNQVKLVDIKQESLDKAIATITKNLDRQMAKGTLTEAEKNTTLGNLTTSTDILTAVADADLVVD